MKRALGGILLLGVAGFAADRALSRWYATWGTRPADRHRTLPGDELTPGATTQTTRSVDIDAPASTVWAWLIQIGQDRAGFYSYRALENLALADMPKVERIVMEWQLRERGEVVWLASPDHWGGNGKQIVAAIEPERHFIMTGEEDWQRIQAGGHARGTWGFIIELLDERRCRLIARSRYAAPPPGFELAHFIMERKMLLRIKALAEEGTSNR
jgi:hypothetical protein